MDSYKVQISLNRIADAVMLYCKSENSVFVFSTRFIVNSSSNVSSSYKLVPLGLLVTGLRLFSDFC
jgi:hypothetical protein